MYNEINNITIDPNTEIPLSEQDRKKLVKALSHRGFVMQAYRDTGVHYNTIRRYKNKGEKGKSETVNKVVAYVKAFLDKIENAA